MTKSTLKIKILTTISVCLWKLQKMYFVPYRRLKYEAEMNIMFMTSDIQKATIQKVLDATSFVRTSCILSA